MFNFKAIGQKITKSIRKTMDVVDSKLFSPQNPDIPTLRQAFFIWRVRSKIHARVWFHTRYTIIKIRIIDRFTKLFPPKPIKISTEPHISKPSFHTPKILHINIKLAVKRIKPILWANLYPIYIALLYFGIQALLLNDIFWQTVWSKWASINYKADLWYEQSNIKLKQRFIHGSSLMKLSIIESFKYILSKLIYLKKSIYNGIYALIQGVDEGSAIRGIFKNLEFYQSKQEAKRLSFKRGARIFGVWWITILVVGQLLIAGIFAVIPELGKPRPFVDRPTTEYNGYLYGVSILNTTETANGTWLNVSANAIKTTSNAVYNGYKVNVYDVKTGYLANSTEITNDSANQIIPIFVNSGGGLRQFKVAIEPISTVSSAYVGVIINSGIQPPRVNGVAKYWVGGTGDYDATTTTHWSLSSGGASGAAVPVATDWVIIDAGSDVGSANFWINITASTASLLTFSLNDPDCLANVSCSAGITFTVTGAVTITGDNFCANSATIVISSGVTSAYGLVIAAAGKWYGGSGTHTIGSISSNVGGGTPSSCTMTSGVCTINGAVGGAYTNALLLLAASTWSNGAGTITLSYASSQLIVCGTKQLNNVISTSAPCFTDSITIAGTLLVNGGVGVRIGYGSTPTMTVTGLITVTSGTLSPYTTNLAILVANGGITVNGGTLSCGSSYIDCNGPFLLSSGTYSHTVATTSTFSSYFNVTGGTMQLTGGTTSFDGTINRTVKCTAGNYFNNVNTAGTAIVVQASELAYLGTYSVGGGTAWYKAGFTLDHPYTISVDTWWTTGASVGGGAGTSFATRLTIPWDILHLTVNANVNLTIVMETNNNNITLGSNYLAAMTAIFYGGLFTTDSSGVVPLGRAAMVANTIRCSIGGTSGAGGFKEGIKSFEGTYNIFNIDWGQDSAGNPTSNANYGLQMSGAGGFAYGCTNREFINYRGVAFLKGIHTWESSTFYGSNSGGAYSVGIGGAKLTLISCTQTTTGIYWAAITTTYGASLSIVGGITKGGAGGGSIYSINGQMVFPVQHYRRAYYQSTDATTSAALSGIQYGAYATGMGDMPISSGTSNATGIWTPANCASPSCLWLPQKTETYIRTTAGAMTWGTPTYTTSAGTSTIFANDPTGTYQSASWSVSVAGGTDIGTVASPITRTMNKTQANINSATFTTDAVNKISGTNVQYFGNYSIDRTSTNVMFHLKHDNGTGFEHKWANVSMTANTTYSLPTIFTAPNTIFSLTTPNGTRQSELIISSGDPAIYPNWANQTYYTRFYVGATAWVNTSTYDNGTYTNSVWVNHTHTWTNETTTAINPTNITITFYTNYTYITNTTTYHWFYNNTQNIWNWSYSQTYSYLNTSHQQVISRSYSSNTSWTNVTRDWTNETSAVNNTLNVTIVHWTNYTLTNNITEYYQWQNGTNLTHIYLYYETINYSNSTWNVTYMKSLVPTFSNITWNNESIVQHNYTKTYRQSDTLNTTWLEIADIILTFTWYNITQVNNQTVWNGSAWSWNETYTYTNLTFHVQTNLPTTNWAVYLTLLAVGVLFAIFVMVIVVRWFRKMMNGE
jgi:hypothetical protein